VRQTAALIFVAAIAFGVACSKNTQPPAESQVPVAGMPSTDAGEKVGQPADLGYTLQDMHGAQVSLASYKGRPLMINFWATWCAPCKSEIPWFIEFKNAHAADGLEILGVSVDDPAEDLRRFATDMKMNYPVLLGLNQDAMLAAYEAEVTVPVTWFIRKDGTIQSRNVGISSREYFASQIQAILGS
jgi:cytochrome c biogenesis protein CcmG/thiol:disulfide interchange protein DsbE